MATTSLVVVALAVGLLTLICVSIRNKSKKEGKVLLKLPLIGDLHTSPIDKPLANWDIWVTQNGPIAVPKLFGIVPIVVLNSYEAVTELFSRRSQWYSNRPASVSMEMITGAEPGQSRFTLMHDYDDHLKLHHRILAPSLGAVAVPQYQSLMELESKQLLLDLSNAARQSQDGSSMISTDTIYCLLERTQSSVILGLHYGLRIPRFEGEPILHEIIDIQTQVTHLAANPGLPDLVPPLRHLPSFLSPWKRAADRLFAPRSTSTCVCSIMGGTQRAGMPRSRPLPPQRSTPRLPPRLQLRTLISPSPWLLPSRAVWRPPRASCCGCSLQRCTSPPL